MTTKDPNVLPALPEPLNSRTAWPTFSLTLEARRAISGGDLPRVKLGATNVHRPTRPTPPLPRPTPSVPRAPSTRVPPEPTRPPEPERRIKRTTRPPSEPESAPSTLGSRTTSTPAPSTTPSIPVPAKTSPAPVGSPRTATSPSTKTRRIYPPPEDSMAVAPRLTYAPTLPLSPLTPMAALSTPTIPLAPGSIATAAPKRLRSSATTSVSAPLPTDITATNPAIRLGWVALIIGLFSLVCTVSLWLLTRGIPIPLVTFGRLAIVLCGVVVTLITAVLTLRTPSVANKERMRAGIGIALATSAIVFEAIAFLLHP